MHRVVVGTVCVQFCKLDGQKWIKKISMVGIPYEYHAGVALDTDRAVICGGQTYNDSWHGLSVLVYHPICGHALRQWHKLELFHTMVMVLGGEQFFVGLILQSQLLSGNIYIFNGETNDNSTVELYSPTTGGTILSTRIVGGCRH